MKVLVTGGNGLIGTATVRYLQEHGHEVRSIDISEGSEITDIDYRVCDIRDYDAVRKQVRGCEAIVHLAALPSPLHGTSAVTFHINVTGTFNVFEGISNGILGLVKALLFSFVIIAIVSLLNKIISNEK